ncbi:MAG: hypothetical protein K8T89_05695 [Planctomycetes bacterium]|nr:hypothetical protein [Planctomycetota bacterium]
MALSESFQFEELDDASRAYLLKVRDRAGKGMPGVFIPQSSSLAGCGFFMGLVIFLGSFILSFQLMEQEPLAVAMLQTAGILLGGWLILAGIRIWMSSGSRSAGHFIYADAETLWECKGSKVIATNLAGLIDASGTQHFKSDGNYQNTKIVVRLEGGALNYIVTNEALGRWLVIFLNLVVWLRTGAKEDVGVNKPVDLDTDFNKLPPVLLSGLAKEIADSGQFPQNITVEGLGLDGDDLPVPSREGRASSSILWYLLIIAVGVGGVFLFKELNVPWPPRT